MARPLVFFSKNNSMKNKKQYKLHKKWFFYKILKQTFFKKKSKYFFLKLSKFFYHKKILLFYFYSLYGKGVKSTIFAKYKKKHICGKRFIFFLNLVELRLNVFIVRIHFVYKVIEEGDEVSLKLLDCLKPNEKLSNNITTIDIHDS